MISEQDLLDTLAANFENLNVKEGELTIPIYLAGMKARGIALSYPTAEKILLNKVTKEGWDMRWGKGKRGRMVRIFTPK